LIHDTNGWPCRHTKWNKPETKGHILYNCTYIGIWNSQVHRK